VLPVDSTFFLAVGDSTLDFGFYSGSKWAAASLMQEDLHAVNLEALRNGLTVLLAKWETGKAPQRKFGKPALRVVISSSWFDFGSVSWNPLASSGKASASYAYSTLIAEGIELQAGDIVRMANSGYQKPLWAIAYAAEVIQLLEWFAQELNARLESVLPTGSAVANAHRKAIGAASILALYEDRTVSIWLCEHGEAKLQGKRGVDRQQVAESEVPVHATLWSRLQLRNPLLASYENLFCVDLRNEPVTAIAKAGNTTLLPISGHDDGLSASLHIAEQVKGEVASVDAIQRLPRVKKPHLFAVLVLLCAIGFLSIKSAHVESAAMTVQGQLSSLHTLNMPKPVQALNKMEQLQVAAVNTAISELNLPVSSLLRAIQPPQDIRVAILGVEFSPDGKSGDGAFLRLSGESRSGEEMVRYAAFIAGRKPILDAYLLHHEVVENDSVKPYRFKLEAKWQE
jgi:hypothetical protein